MGSAELSATRPPQPGCGGGATPPAAALGASDTCSPRRTAFCVRNGKTYIRHVLRDILRNRQASSAAPRRPAPNFSTQGAARNGGGVGWPGARGLMRGREIKTAAWSPRNGVLRVNCFDLGVPSSWGCCSFAATFGLSGLLPGVCAELGRAGDRSS